MLKISEIEPPDIPQVQCTGYLNQAYAHSLSEFGNPRLLPQSQGSILEREILESSYRDAMGCYPLFACKDWAHLSEDIK